jgi:hypothetical protein
MEKNFTFQFYAYFKKDIVKIIYKLSKNYRAINIQNKY